MNRTHSAKYLILLGSPEAPRALLFNGQHHYLAEMIDDDGMMVDNLLRSSRRCPPPRGLELNAGGESVRCFSLGD